MPELKERALRMFVVPLGAAPRISGSGVVMAGVTALLIINVAKAIEELMGSPMKPGAHRAEIIRCCGELNKRRKRAAG